MKKLCISLAKYWHTWTYAGKNTLDWINPRTGNPWSIHLQQQANMWGWWAWGYDYRTGPELFQTRPDRLVYFWKQPWCWQGLLWIDPAWKRSKWIQNWKCIQNWTCFNFLQGQFWIRVDPFWTSSRMVQSKQKGQSGPIYQSDPFGISLKIRTSPVQIVIVKKSIVFLIKPLLVLISLVVWHRASLYWSNGIKTRLFNALIINLSFCCKGILWIKGKIELLVQKPMWKMICKLQSFLGIYLTQGSP